MLEIGATPPGEKAEQIDSGKSAGSGAPAVLLALVPNSAIQFVDFAMSEEMVAHTRRNFFEDRAGSSEPSLHVASAGGEVFYHPVTNEPCDPARTYTLSGVEAIEPFLDTWLPLPFMRVSQRDDDDALMLDEGPSNWTRVHISREQAAEGVRRYRVVLAIDTAVEADASARARSYAAPTLEDLKAGAAYRFSDDVNDIAWFVSEAWVDDWIRGAFDARRSQRTDIDAAGALEHLAGYLTLLAVLKEACDLPALRFMEPNAVGAYAEAMPVDLALDLGSSRIAALVQERQASGELVSRTDNGSAGAIWQLTLRDLSRPTRTMEGTWPSALTFSRATFGNESLSRWSGRTHAFHWPSPIRIGAEAVRLAAEATVVEATTGVSSAMHYVWDERPSRHVWRLACTDADEQSKRNPVVSGSILAHLSESGDLLESRNSQGVTTKPRFSRSSLVTLMTAEILLQATSGINSPEARGKRGRPAAVRRIERILVTPPSGMGDAEVAILRRRVEAAVTLVWQTMGWHGEDHTLAPPAPTVSIVADAQTCTQIAYLENEIAYKFRGKAEGLLSLAGRARAGFAGARVLRIATLDIGAATTGLSVVTWEPSAGGALSATRQLVDGFDLGCDDILKVLADRFVLAALMQRLAECRHADPAKLIRALLGPEDRGRPTWVGDLGRRLAAELLAPSATAMLRLYAHGEVDAGDAPTELSIATLLATVGIEAKGVADRLDIVAADDGADGFAPLDVTVPFLMRDVGGVVREVLRPMLDAVVRVLTALDCDLVLLSGGGAQLPAVTEVLQAGIPLRPDRIVGLHRHRFAAWLPPRAAGDTKQLPAAGALVLGRGAFGEGGPGITVRSHDRSAEGGFVGKLGPDGRIRRDDVLFERDPATVRSGQQQRQVTVGLPAQFGSRVPSLESWPARPCWSIERNPESTGRTPKLPLKVTLELMPAERGKPASLKLVSAIDGDGGRLDPDEIVMRLKTRRFGDGYWLDTGHMVGVGAGVGS